jgi:hypothetical protein
MVNSSSVSRVLKNPRTAVRVPRTGNRFAADSLFRG